MHQGTRDRITKNIINANISRPIDSGYKNFGYPRRSIPHLKIKVLGKYNINIETWADIDRQTYYCWGDFWVKEKLQKAFEELGANVGVAPRDADFTVYLWGSPYKQRLSWPFFYNPLPSNVNICWHYSHPTKMTQEELYKYKIVFCLSENHIQTIKSLHPNVISEPMISCTDFDLPKFTHDDDTYPIDVLFVGNARGGLEYGRKAVRWLEPMNKDMKIEVYGHKWHMGKFDWMQQWYAGQYWKYEELNKIYNRARITLVDGHDDMGQFGFVPMKIFDVLASGGFVLSTVNIGIENIFGNSVPQFSNKQEMNESIRYFLEHEKERIKLSKVGRKIVLAETFKSRAEKFIEVFELNKIRN